MLIYYLNIKDKERYCLLVNRLGFLFTDVLRIPQYVDSNLKKDVNPYLTLTSKLWLPYPKSL